MTRDEAEDRHKLAYEEWAASNERCASLARELSDLALTEERIKKQLQAEKELERTKAFKLTVCAQAAVFAIDGPLAQGGPVGQA